MAGFKLLGNLDHCLQRKPDYRRTRSSGNKQVARTLRSGPPKAHKRKEYPEMNLKQKGPAAVSQRRRARDTFRCRMQDIPAAAIISIISNKSLPSISNFRSHPG